MPGRNADSESHRWWAWIIHHTQQSAPSCDELPPGLRLLAVSLCFTPKLKVSSSPLLPLRMIASDAAATAASLGPPSAPKPLRPRCCTALRVLPDGLPAAEAAAADGGAAAAGGSRKLSTGEPLLDLLQQLMRV